MFFVCYLFAIDTCSLPANSGPCTAMVPQWFFNTVEGKCEHFLYGGCSGNDNRFNMLTSCIKKCGMLMNTYFIEYQLYSGLNNLLF